jgi:hypothetical protein
MKTTFKHLSGQPGKITLICLVCISAGFFSQAAGYTPIKQLINKSAAGVISTFGVRSDTSIFDSNSSLRVMRVTIIQFDCFRQNKDVIIKWRTDDENELLGYELQRSTDQVRFTTIAQFTPKRGHINDYQFIDIPDEQSIVYYRLKIMYPTYNAYSIIKKLNNSTTIKKSVIIQPNIIVDHIELTIEENGAVWGDIVIHNPQGALVYFKKQILLTGKNQILLTNLPPLKMGTYFLMIHFSNDKISETSILVKN